MNKQEQIEIALAQPYKVGDVVVIRMSYSVFETEKVKKQFVQVEKTFKYNDNGKITEIEDDCFIIDCKGTSTRKPSHIRVGYTDQVRIPKEFVSHAIGHIGADPFAKDDLRVDSYSIDIEGIIHRFDNSRCLDSYGIPEIDWEPVVTIDGKQVTYQREFCWELKDKQLLIESIYNGVDIGKFILRNNNFDKTFENKGKPHNAFKQIVDGKQRVKAILDFLAGEYPDLHGNYWQDLSALAQSKFKRFRNASYAEVDEKATDQQVLTLFLKINHAGKPMSEEHINFVKNLLK